MKNNAEILDDFLSCMIRLTDRLHQTNKKLIDLYGKIDSIDNVTSLIKELEKRIDELTTNDIKEINSNTIKQLDVNSEILNNINSSKK